MITVVKTQIGCIGLWGTAPVLATDGECPDRYEFPLCTVTLCSSEALSLSILIVLEDSTSCGLNEIFLSIYAKWPAISFFQCGVVAVFLHLIYNTEMDNRVRTLALAHNPIASNLWWNKMISLIFQLVRDGSQNSWEWPSCFQTWEIQLSIGGHSRCRDISIHHLANDGLKRCESIISQRSKYW